MRRRAVAGMDADAAVQAEPFPKGDCLAHVHFYNQPVASSGLHVRGGRTGSP
jgi:hypothetical protein